TGSADTIGSAGGGSASGASTTSGSAIASTAGSAAPGSAARGSSGGGSTTGPAAGTATASSARSANEISFFQIELSLPPRALRPSVPPVFRSAMLRLDPGDAQPAAQIRGVVLFLP